MKEETSSSWVGDDTLWNWDGPNLTPPETSKLTADCMGLLELERQLRLFDKVLPWLLLMDWIYLLQKQPVLQVSVKLITLWTGHRTQVSHMCVM